MPIPRRVSVERYRCAGPQPAESCGHRLERGETRVELTEVDGSRRWALCERCFDRIGSTLTIVPRSEA